MLIMVGVATARHSVTGDNIVDICMYRGIKLIIENIQEADTFNLIWLEWARF